MSLKVVGEFNNLSEEMLKRIPELKPGQVVTYELLDGIWDPNDKIFRYGGVKTYRGKDTVRDVKTGRLIEIGIPKDIDENRVVSCAKYRLDGGGENGMVGARFHLSADKLDDLQWIAFFSLCNFNDSNPFRDKSVPALIRVLDYKKIQEEGKRQRNIRKQALILVDSLQPDDVRLFAAAKSQDLSKDISELRIWIEEYADNEPALFVEEWSDPVTKTKATVKLALDEKVIGFDPLSYKIIWPENQHTIAKLDKDDEGKSYVDLFAEWLKMSKNGSDMLRSIEKRLKVALKKKIGEEVTAEDEKE